MPHFIATLGFNDRLEFLVRIVSQRIAFDRIKTFVLLYMCLYSYILQMNQQSIKPIAT